MHTHPSVPILSQILSFVHNKAFFRQARLMIIRIMMRCQRFLNIFCKIHTSGCAKLNKTDYSGTRRSDRSNLLGVCFVLFRLRKHHHRYSFSITFLARFQLLTEKERCYALFSGLTYPFPRLPKGFERSISPAFSTIVSITFFSIRLHFR